MRIIADTHVHLYPCYDAEKLFGCALRRLGEHDGSAVKMVCLTERADCHYFRDLREGRAGCPLPGAECEVGGEGEVVLLKREGGVELYVLAGRQIVTAERLEILALTLDRSFPDGEPAEAMIRAILESGGVPVLSWAPGKWFFGRRRTVGSLIESFQAGELLVGDTSLRPTIWPEPFLMQRARRAGLGVLAGSDPLPAPGEEIFAGGYATLLDADFDDRGPVASIRRALKSPGLCVQRVGRRCGLIEALARLRRHASGSA
jgi:hypothetical protein